MLASPLQVTTKLDKDALAAASGAGGDASTHAQRSGASGVLSSLGLQRFFKPSPSTAALQVVEEVIGIITSECRLGELWWLLVGRGGGGCGVVGEPW